MRIKDKNLFYKNICIFLLIIAFVGLIGCSLQYTNVFSVKTPSPDNLIESGKEESQMNDVSTYPDNIDSHKDGKADKDEETNKGEAVDKDSADSAGKNMNEDIDKGMNKDIEEDRQEDMEKEGDGDIHSDHIDDEKVIDNQESSDDQSSDLDIGEAVPAAKIIRNSPDRESKRVAITFDDGPDGHFTPQILDILKKYHAKATFFILGSVADENREVLKRIDEEGHVVASHSWSHSNFTKISKSKAIDELKRTNDLIKEVIGKSNSLFRLPYGAFNDNVLATVADQGFHNIYWSIDPKDWSGISPNKILKNIEQNIEPGAIILLHSSGSKKSIPNTVKALPNIIEFLQGQGYEIVTIPELLK